MATVQQRYKERTDKFRQPAPRYAIGDKIVTREVVELDVAGKIYNHFRVDLLLPADNNPLPSQVIEDKTPGPVENLNDPGEDGYAVDEILRCRTWKGERQAFIKWSGHGRPEWTSLASLQETEALDK
ncbi:hypothetical protein K3495_g9367 [Podosphaera aphanis]|nr:hypothetical protein K3495_g9367 [Podosphaera aphanis]